MQGFAGVLSNIDDAKVVKKERKVIFDTSRNNLSTPPVNLQCPRKYSSTLFIFQSHSQKETIAGGRCMYNERARFSGGHGTPDGPS
jgi:hypothetical protein